MAIARGAGTEILRAHQFAVVDSTNTVLIKGAQHHVYTFLSGVWYAQAVQAAGNWITMWLLGYDEKAGTTDVVMYFFQQDMSLDQTYVWNDKFSFNGYEPVDFTGPVDTEAKQDAIADQAVSGDSNRQILYVATENAADDIDVTCTFLDQNNA